MKNICKIFLAFLFLLFLTVNLIGQSNSIVTAQKFLDEGKKSYNLHKYHLAEQYFIQARQIYKQHKIKIKLAEVDFYLSEAEYYLLKYDRAIKYAKESKTLYQNLLQKANAQKAHYILENIYYKKYKSSGLLALKKNDYELAKKRFKQSLLFCKDKPEKKAANYFYLAKIYLATNKTDSSLYFANAAHHIFSSLPQANIQNSAIRKNIKECLKLEALIYDSKQYYNQEANVLTKLISSFGNSMEPKEKKENLENLIIAYLNANRLKDALLVMNEFSQGDSSISRIYTGILYERLGHFDKAIDILKNMHKEFLSTNNVKEDIFCLNELWRLQLRQKEYEAADSSLREFLSYSNELTSKQYLSAILARIKIQELKENVISAGKLIRLFENTLKTKSAELTERDRGHYIINLAEIYLNFDQFDSAAAIINRYRNEILSFRDNRVRVEFLMISGQLANNKGEYNKAIKNYKAAFEIARANYYMGAVTRALLDVGNIYYNLGNNSNALIWYKQAKKIIMSSKDSTNLPTYFTNMANIYKNIQKPDSAIHYYEKSIKCSKKIGVLNQLPYNYYFLGKLYEKKGEIQKAEKCFQNAQIGFAEITVDDPFHRENKWNRVQMIVDNYNRLIDISYKLGKKKQGDKYRNLRNAFFANNPLLISLRKANLSEDSLTSPQRNLLHQLKNAPSDSGSQIVSVELVRGKSNASNVSEEIDELIENYEQKLDNIKFQYGSQMPQYMAISPEQLSNLQSYLPNDVLLLAFFPADDQLFIFAIKKKYRNIFSVSIPRKKLYKKIRNFKENIHVFETMLAIRNVDSTQISVAKEKLSSFQKISHDLYNVLFMPVENIVDQNAKYILIIPSGLLSYIPFQALVYFSNEKPHYLLEKYKISYQNGNTILSTLTRMRLTVHNYRLLALGDPDGSLPNALQEVKAIYKEFPNSSKIFLGREATEDSLFKYCRNYNLLHFATHAKLNYFNNYKSYILLTPTSRYNGKLTRDDIYKMDLSAVELVTLSACETAVGEKVPKSETENIANAFLRKNVSSVVASLWSVSDISTKELMVEFYKNLKTQSKSEALRNAQLYLLKKTCFNNPYYWAAFELIGDWR